MDLSISIVSWNTRDLLGQCLTSVYDTADGLELEVIVVDNASSDGSAEMVRSKYPDVKLIENSDNVGFARANNQAFEHSAGRCLLLLNPDTVCLPGAPPGLIRFLDENPKAGAVGPLVLNADKMLQYSWARFPTLWSEAIGKLDRRIGPRGVWPGTADEVCALGPFPVDWIGGCCLMVKRGAVEQIGPMDESLFMYSEETDWCLRLRKAGWEVWVEPGAQIVHLAGQSSVQAPGETALRLRRSKAVLFTKHHGRCAGTVLGGVLGLKFHIKRAIRLAAFPCISGRGAFSEWRR
jgi:hypothetical protein